jgi:ArsR family transcriptional regulator, lead/cadmium/zinc/bismuth-responsive transcriptional repressor
MSGSLAVSNELCQEDCIHPDAVRRALALLQEPAVYRDLAELFGALADPTRARIIHALLHQQLCSCDLAAVVGITKSGASQHLRVLRSLHLVKSHRAGKFVYYSLDDAHIALLLQVGLTHLGHDEVTALQSGTTPAFTEAVR